jgi:hypothetical protein
MRQRFGAEGADTSRYASRDQPEGDTEQNGVLRLLTAIRELLTDSA